MEPDDVMALEAWLNDPEIYHSNEGSYGGDGFDYDGDPTCGRCRPCVDGSGTCMTEDWGCCLCRSCVATENQECDCEESSSCHACVTWDKILKLLPSDYEAGDVVEDGISHLASVIVQRAVKVGRLVKLSCEMCDPTPYGARKPSKEEIVQAHHDDYREPLEVRWLCTKHHGEAHDIRKSRKPQRVPHLLFVGEAPTLRSPQLDDSSSGRRLVRLCGVDIISKVGVHVNVFDRPLGRISPKRSGDRWPEKEARARGKELFGSLPQAPIVLLGQRVADAVLGRKVPHFSRTTDREVVRRQLSRSFNCKITEREIDDQLKLGAFLVITHGPASMFQVHHDPSGRRTFFVIPHPSGTNRFWNHPKAEEDARVSLKCFIDHVRRDRVPWMGRDQLHAWKADFERGRRRFGDRDDRSPK